jgi:hypothetical protein
MTLLIEYVIAINILSEIFHLKEFIICNMLYLL